MEQPAPSKPLTTEQEVGFYVDLWKKEVDVQQHFNDIEFRIRGLALTVATFVLGAGAVAAKDTVKIGPVSLGAAVVTLGLLLWLAFYFVDRYWYHQFLSASVAHGRKIEEKLQEHLEIAGMTSAISESSPGSLKWPARAFGPPRTIFKSSEKRVLHSADKITVFYKIGATVFVIAALGMQAAAMFPGEAAPTEVLTVRVVEPSADVSSTPISPPAPTPIPS